MGKLLNIDANPKTVKGRAHGYATAVLYLSPYTLSGHNLCPLAEAAGCWRTCLNVQGRASMPIGGKHMTANGITLPENPIQRARLARTQRWHDNPRRFVDDLIAEIDAHIARALRKNLTPVIRLNGTSDIVWERKAPEIFTTFPHAQFYDYTKLPERLQNGRRMPANYHLSISWSGANERYRAHAERWAVSTGAPLVVVTRNGLATVSGYQPIAERIGAAHIVDGDETDLRFLEQPHTLVILRAKGSAKRESNGFVAGMV